MHGGLVGVALVCRSDRDRAREGTERAVAFIDVEADSEEAAPDPESRIETDEAGGSAAPAAIAGPPAPAPRAAHPAVKRRAESEDADDPEPSAVSSASARIAATRPSPTPATGGNESGMGIGSGIGDGASTGSGVGTGAGRGRGPAGATVRMRSPPRPPRSRARPARLVYPVRDREERPGEVFVVVLTVNEKGYVVGVRLEQGVSRDRDEKALNAVWRFHYDPALDRDGRPIRSQVVQRFMVE